MDKVVGKLEIRNDGGTVRRIVLNGNNADIFAGGNDTDGLVVIMNKGGEEIVRMGHDPLSVDAAAGLVAVNDPTGRETIRLVGQTGDIRLGGNGAGGDLSVRNKDGAETIRLVGQTGQLRVGGNGLEGDLRLRDQAGTLWMDARAGRIVLSNLGFERVRVDGKGGLEEGSPIFFARSPSASGDIGKTEVILCSFHTDTVSLKNSRLDYFVGVQGRSEDTFWKYGPDHFRLGGYGVRGIGTRAGVSAVGKGDSGYGLIAESESTWAIVGQGADYDPQHNQRGAARFDGHVLVVGRLSTVNHKSWSLFAEGADYDDQDPSAASGAAKFWGKVEVYGHLHASEFSATTKQFRIDHPLDPANKYLVHSSVESAERLNVYSGSAVLDENGEADVQLPDWFGALNCDFRYQLTAVGASAPGLHIAREMRDNLFSIGGGQKNLKVSWQVTGVRRDAYAMAHPIRVEVEKRGTERGRYLHPGEHGVGSEQGIHNRERVDSSHVDTDTGERMASPARTRNRYDEGSRND